MEEPVPEAAAATEEEQERDVRDASAEGNEEEGALEDEGEEGDDYEEEEEEERCELEFVDGTDPIDLVQDTHDGVELYRQFELLERQALAADRKRKGCPFSDEGGGPSKRPRQDDFLGATMEEIDEIMNFGFRRRRPRGSRGKKGRRRGSTKRLKPEVSRKIGDATLHYASGKYKEAVPLLHEVVRLAPNVSDGYYLLGLIHDSLGDRKKAFNFHMIAAFFSRRDASLWKKLVAWSIEMGDVALVKHCLSKAIIADPDDVGLKFDGALLYFKAGEFLKAAELYEQIVGVSPDNLEARKMAAKMYRKCGRTEKGIQILEDYINSNKQKPDLSVIDLLITLYMSNNAHNKALQHIENYHAALNSGKLPFHLEAKATVCRAQLGDMSHAEVFIQHIPLETTKESIDVIAEVADSFFEMEKYDYALKFYLKLECITDDPDGDLYKKIAECCISLKERRKAVPFFYKALNKMEQNVEIRLTLASILLEEGKNDEAIILLSPPSDLENLISEPKSWWLNGEVKIQLAKIYHSQGMLENFADTIFSLVRDTLTIESANQKVRPVKKLSNHVLKKRAELLAEQEPDSVFRGFRPFASQAELLKANRAKKLLQKREALKEEKRAIAIASGLEWHSDDSDDEPERREKQEPPLAGFLQKQENHQLLVDLCKALASLHRYWEALEVINKTLKVAYDDIISSQRKEELRSLGAQIAYGTSDPKHGFDYVKYIVQQHPYSNAAWNCYYKVVSRLEDRYSRHNKFIRSMRNMNDCVPPVIISGHQFNSLNQHQASTADYLEAYKLQPDNPLINLCVGTSLINLALGFRLKNKHHCILQGFSFLYKYSCLCDNSQEALYNVARAYHNVGLVTLAAYYYEKVLAMKQKDEPVPRLPYEKPLPDQKELKPNYCDLRREAAYNLHLIYKKSGAIDLARQILKNHCTV